MSARLNDKLSCPRCGAPSSETSIMCEQHRLEAAATQSRWAARRRPWRRRLGRCAFCADPSSTYRCKVCADKRRRWDAGQSVNDLVTEPPQQELDFGWSAGDDDNERDPGES